jgi:hypothetical protein
MSPFEYLSAFISILLGLGITQLITGVADLFVRNSRPSFYWLHSMWVVLVFFLHIQEWWSLYELRNEVWSLPGFLFQLLYPITLFLLARLLFPYGMETSGEPKSLRVFYFEHYRTFFFLISFLAVNALLENHFVRHLPWREQILQLLILITSFFIALLRLQRPWVHHLFCGLLLLALTGYFILNWNQLLLVTS